MSELLYTPRSQTELAWIQPCDRVFTIDEGKHAGKTIKVRITQNQEDIDLDGEPDMLNAKVSAELVDEQTGQLVEIDGRAVKIPSTVHGIMLDEVANGNLDVVNWMAELAEAAIFRVLRTEAGLVSFSLIYTE